jgi:hypothetical protein
VFKNTWEDWGNYFAFQEKLRNSLFIKFVAKTQIQTIIYGGLTEKAVSVKDRYLLYRVIHLLPPVAKLTLKIMISLSYFADLIYNP